MYKSSNTFLKKHPDIQWKLEEIGIVLDNYKLSLDRAIETNAQRLIPYFTRALVDENPEIQRLARLGLKKAKDALNLL